MLTDCKSCSGAISAVEGYREREERFEGKYAGITSATYTSTLNGVTKVLARSQTEGAKVLDNHGAVIKTIPPQTGNLSVQLRFEGQWRVAEVQGFA
jgi:hypothetical protein